MYYDESWGRNSGPVSLRPFLRTLVGRPDLARHVKYVKIHFWKGFGESIAIDQPKTWEEGQDLKLNDIKGKLWKEGESMEYTTDEGVDLKETMLLLALTRNVERLEFQLPSRVAAIGSLLGQAICSYDQAMLSKLKTLQFNVLECVKSDELNAEKKVMKFKLRDIQKIPRLALPDHLSGTQGRH
ncbi:MAG: hypothetical protein MMC23_008728 [Stictis urceolatum]|nr:hypothetical protein [Stictis urceolata]